jgi:hypothetical protein
LFQRRVRQRRIPDAWDQCGYRSREWLDPTHNNGTTPILSQDRTFDPRFEFLLSRGLQVTADENHSAEAINLENGRGDVGGDFTSTRRWCQVDDGQRHHFDAQGMDPGGTWRHQIYDGPVLSITPHNNLFTENSLGNLTTLGATAISRCKPTNNISNLSTDFVELYQGGLPSFWGSHLWKDRTNIARGAGNEYLNQEFGWLPLVSDIRNASYALANADRLMNDYESRSGHEVRRRYEFPLVDTRTTEVQSAAADPIVFGFNPQQLLIDSSKSRYPIYKTTRSYRRTWFSGAFTYHLPTDYFSRTWLGEKAREASYLFGIELTPEVVWNATPWTWAIDWFSNAGDVVSNLSDWATDGLVMRYGYIMEHSFTSVTYFSTASRFKPLGQVRPTSVTACVESKRRMKASPFGFGVSWNSFSPRQLAIAAALGIVRVF